MIKTITPLLLMFMTETINAQSISFTELTPGPSFFDARNGSIASGDIDNDGDIDILLTGKNGNTLHSSLYTNDGNGNFSLVAETPFVGLQFGETEFADVDNDGDLDVLMTGFNNQPVYFANLYLNNGSGVFNLAINTPFEPSSNGDFAFEDIDNDGDQDLMMVGYDTSGNGFAKLYSNNGSGIFTQLSNSTFMPAKEGAIAFIDYDLDGDRDLMISGEDNSGISLTTLYANDGSGLFTIINNANFPGKNTGDIGVADTDNDGDPDIILTGSSGSPLDNTDFYTNNGDGSFSLNTTNDFPSDLILGNVEFADFDNDGDKDLILTGFINASGSQFVGQIFQNMGNNTFQLADTLVPAYLTDLVVADIDNDSDLDAIVLGITGTATDVFKTRTYLNNLNPVGINESKFLQEVNLFPNPTNNFLHINCIDNFIDSIKIFDVTGKLILEEDIKSCGYDIDMTHQPDGLYLLIMYFNSNQQVTKRIIKE